MTHLDHTVPDWKAHDGPVCVLGAGGAARAIVHGFLEAGVDEVRVFNRTRARAEQLAAALRPARQGIRLERPQRRRARRLRAGQHDRAGMKGGGALGMDVAGFTEDCVVADIVYVPLETQLLAQARARGLRTVDGLGMLLHQAVPGFENGSACVQRSPTIARHHRRRHRGPHDADRRSHRLDRHGQVDGRGASARARLAGVRRRRGGASPLRRRKPSRRSSAPSPARRDGSVDRAKLSAALLAASGRFAPRSHRASAGARGRARLPARASRAGAAIAVLEIPLLFETGADELVDVAIVVSAPAGGPARAAADAARA